MAQKHILIVGSGSVGKRHARNLSMLGCSISGVDPREDRRRELSEAVNAVNTYATLDEALAAEAFDGAVIASPPKYHVDQACTALTRGLPVLLEKPVAPDLESALALRRVVESTGAPLLLGYTWRWWEPLQYVRELLQRKTVGQLLSAGFIMSAHLADWHPWESYRDFFMSSKELGGGALLDESHWIDVMLWFFGRPRQLFARIDKISSLDIETDDNVDIMVEYTDGLRVTLHLDLYGRPHEKSIRLVGEEGTIYWTTEPSQIALSKTMEKKWDVTEYSCERNDMFVQLAKDFLEMLRGTPVNNCTIDDGVAVLEIIEAVRQSSREQRMIALAGGSR